MYRSVNPSTGSRSGASAGRYSTCSQACWARTQARIARLVWAGRLSHTTMTGQLPPSSRRKAATTPMSWSVS